MSWINRTLQLCFLVARFTLSHATPMVSSDDDYEYDDPYKSADSNLNKNDTKNPTTESTTTPKTEATTEWVSQRPQVAPSDKYGVDSVKQSILDGYISHKNELGMFCPINETCPSATDRFRRPDRSIPDENTYRKNPSASDPLDLLSSMGLYRKKKGNKDMLLGNLFTETPMINRFIILDADSFIQGGQSDLRNLIKSGFDTSFKNSALVNFGKSMNRIRPHIAYAIAISWNVQHYRFDMKKIDCDGVVVAKNEVSAIDDNTSHSVTNVILGDCLGKSISEEGKKSEITNYLGALEKNFEDFVIEVQLWAIQSMASTFKVVKSVHRAMKSGSKAYTYLIDSERASATNEPMKIQNTLVEAMVYSQSEMMQHLGKVPTVLEDLLDSIESVKLFMRKNLMSTVRNAKDQTNKEISISTGIDNNAKFADTELKQNINNTNVFLNTNQINIVASENALSNNVKAIYDLIEDKRKANNDFLSEIDKFTSRKLKASEELDRLFNSFRSGQRQLRKTLENDRVKMKCLVTPKKFFASVKKCQSTRYDYTTSGGGCRTKCFLFWCKRSCWSGTRRYYPVTIVDHTCVKKALEEEKRRFVLQGDIDRKNCEMQLRQFEGILEEYKNNQKKLNNIYIRKQNFVNQQMKEIDDVKREQKKVSEEFKAFIDIQKKENMHKRAKLLQLQENQIRGQRVALLVKQDLENKIKEFTSVTNTLQLTEMALGEVLTALKTVYVSLNKFQVQLESLKVLILDQVKNFEEIQRKLAKSQTQISKMNNINIMSDNMKEVYTDSLHAGVGLIILNQLYDVLFDYMAELEEYPVGLYSHDLTLNQNVRRFERFVKKMNNQKLVLDDLDGDLEHKRKERKSINKEMEDRGIAPNQSENLETIDELETSMKTKFVNY